MALSKQDCAKLRVVINRAANGPDWYNDPGFLTAELRHQTQMWVRKQLIRELQQMLPPDERVKFDAVGIRS